jgi:hypothetical protein
LRALFLFFQMSSRLIYDASFGARFRLIFAIAKFEAQFSVRVWARRGRVRAMQSSGRNQRDAS